MNREECLARVAAAMAAYDSGSAHRIHHFTKVHGFARTIAVLEGLDEEQRFTLELAALTGTGRLAPARFKNSTRLKNTANTERICFFLFI